ncbi:MAG: BNR-4 repeat-containing protein, partial [Planctomycetota bacterium]
MLEIRRPVRVLLCPIIACGLAHGADWQLTTIADNGVKESRRPHAPGVYAAAVDTTFLSWSGTGSQPYVMSYDHQQQHFSEAVHIAPEQDIRSDKHNYPHMILTQDGYLHVFVMRGRTLQFRSPAPYTIDGEWECLRPPINGSYQLPVTCSNGDVFMFAREGTNGIAYVHSQDHGLTWTKHDGISFS